MADFARNTTQVFLQRSLVEVVRKLRSSTGGSQEELIEQFVRDTIQETNSSVQLVKVSAIQKAIYFHMLGYSAAYANFRAVEVMADSVFANKRTGYVAACTTFSEDTEVLPLMTALLKRDLNSSNSYETGLALYCIASICTPDLAKDLVSDVVHLLQHPRTYVRKKAVLSLYKLFLQYPESLRPTYPILKGKLEDNSEYSDTDPAVRGTVVCVLCELSRRNPANYLGLAVPFFSLLSTVHSNWTLIKVIKVFGYFAQLEPRLGKKLAEPLTELITTMGAKSVQFECLLAVAMGMSKVASLTKLAAEKLRLFVEDPDQNLKYLGLHAMFHLAADNSKLLMDQHAAVLRCLGDTDVTIRCKALQVLKRLVTAKNIVTTINTMLYHAMRDPEEEEWTNIVIRIIIETARTSDYGFLTDFEWYMGILVDMSVMELTVFREGSLLEEELITILMRVNGARQFGVDALSQLIHVGSPLLKADRERSTQWHIIRAVAFGCGEYPYWLTDKKMTCENLLSDSVALLPANVQLTCVSAVGKIIAYMAKPCARHLHLCNGEEELAPLETEDATTLDDLRNFLLSSEGESASPTLQLPRLERFCCSLYPSVQERANLVRYLLTENPQLGSKFYEKELQPVAFGAQETLEVPEGIDLDKPFCENTATLMALSSSDADEEGERRRDDSDNDFDLKYRIERQGKLEKARRDEMSAFYVKDFQDASSPDHVEASGAASPMGNGGIAKSAQSWHCVRAAGPRHPGKKLHAINRDFVKPSGYTVTAKAKRTNSPEEDEAARKLRHIDVTRKLSADECLPEAVPYFALRKEIGPMASASAVRAVPNAKGAEDLLPAVLSPALTLYEQGALRVVLYVDKCKIYKDGIRLSACLKITNLSSATTLHEVVLTTGGSEDVGDGVCLAYPPGLVVLEMDRKEEKLDAAASVKLGATPKDSEASSAVLLSKKLKGGAVTHTAVIVRLLETPESFLAPLPFFLNFICDKKRVHVPVQMPFQYAFFAKSQPPPMTAEDFNVAILQTALKEVSTASAFLPCDRATIMAAIWLLERDLHLVPIEIFKAAATFYGILCLSKASSKCAHVAVLLRELEVGGVRGLDVCVRTHNVAFAELLIQGVADILQSSVAMPT